MIAIEPKTEWIDKKGKPLTVLSVDYDKDELVFNRPETPSVKRTVTIEVFTNQAKPASQQQPSEPKTKPTKAGQYSFAIIDELHTSLGKSEILQLAHQEWLERGMHAKTVKFDIGQGGMAPEVNWEDKCAAIASVYNRPAKSLASIILWGNDSAWDWSEAFNEVTNHLASHMIAQCKEHDRNEPKGCKHNLTDLAQLMARMVLYFELYQLWDVYTVKGRLLFSGIEMNDRTYSNHFLWYQKQMLADLEGLVITINDAVSWYRRKLNEEE
ncbi:hypothetical protein ACS8E3_07750 [Psychrobacter sp. 2Y5]|uniref:hypothetical protein n=1 Tax=unclassified Psychrobacter TaxID=196806 RepID=UPI003F44B90D